MPARRLDAGIQAVQGRWSAAAAYAAGLISWILGLLCGAALR